MPEKDEQDIEPTFGNCHGDTIPESERVTERKPRGIRNYLKPPPDPDAE